MKNIIKSWYSRGVALSLCGLLLLQLAACGTLIYPERRGQSKGELDPLIVVLDAVGILFFIIPGVASFIIDFNTGAIYLPPGQRSQQRVDKIREGFKGARVDAGSDGSMTMHLDPQQLTPDTIENFGKFVGDESFSLTHPDLEVQRLDVGTYALGTVHGWQTSAFALQTAKPRVM